MAERCGSCPSAQHSFPLEKVSSNGPTPFHIACVLLRSCAQCKTFTAPRIYDAPPRLPCVSLWRRSACWMEGTRLRDARSTCHASNCTPQIDPQRHGLAARTLSYATFLSCERACTCTSKHICALLSPDQVHNDSGRQSEVALLKPPCYATAKMGKDVSVHCVRVSSIP